MFRRLLLLHIHKNSLQIHFGFLYLSQSLPDFRVVIHSSVFSHLPSHRIEPSTPFVPSLPLSRSALDPSLLTFSGENFLLCRAKLSHAYLYGYKHFKLPYFPVDNARVIYTKMFSKREKTTVRVIHKVRVIQLKSKKFQNT
jgi:hypothetical protein